MCLPVKAGFLKEILLGNRLFIYEEKTKGDFDALNIHGII